MAILDFLGGIVDSAVQGSSTAAQVAVQKEIAEKNLNFQKETLQYQKDLQKEIFAREDNSVQRRVADLEAAGINKTLAAGSGASAGEAIGVITPQQDSSWVDKISGFSGLAGVFLDNAMKTAQAKEAQADAEIAEHDAKIITGQNVWTSGTYSNPWLQVGMYIADKLGLDFEFPDLDGSGTGSSDIPSGVPEVTDPRLNSDGSINFDWYSSNKYTMADWNFLLDHTTYDERRSHGYTR